MDGGRLSDLISRGMGRAALRAGASCDAYRPAGIANPLDPANRFLRLNALFNAQDPGFRRAGAYGQGVWYGVFDSAYTRPGDYLVERDAPRTWFIAAQPNLLPVVCVHTDRVVSFSRPSAPRLPGVNPYGGVVRTCLTPLLTFWPASVLSGRGTMSTSGQLPEDVRLPGFQVLLPAIAGVSLQVDDLMTDDLGRNFVIDAAELSSLGWRLSVMQAAP